MRDYLKIYSLEERFKKAIINTSLSGSIFKHSVTHTSISLKISNENNYIMDINLNYENIEDLEKFIILVEQLKIISLNPSYEIQLIPFGNGFNIFINGELVEPNSLLYYSNLVKIDLSTIIESVLGDIQTESRIVSYLWHQINDKQMNINNKISLLNRLNFSSSILEKRKIKLELLVEDATPFDSNDKYCIDLLKIIEIIERYHKAFESNDRNERERVNSELIEQYNKLIKVIESGKRITTNYNTISKSLTAQQLKMVLDFCEQLLKITSDMKINANDILSYKSRKLETFYSLVKVKDEVNTMLDLFKEKEEPRKYQANIRFPISIEYHDYSKGNFNFQMEKTDNVFQNIQKQQLERLTQEERDSLVYYKSILYRPINRVVAFIREKGLTLEEVEKNDDLYKMVIKIVSECYDEFVKRNEEIKKSEFLPLLEKNKNNPPSVQRLLGSYPNGIPSKEQYISIVLSSIPVLENALKKVVAPEDIIVYRGTTSGTTLKMDERFISTSISLETAKSFLKEFDRTSDNKQPFYSIFQILIPKGSPLIVFTDDLFLDSYIKGKVFNEEQLEVLIDPNNFDFEYSYGNSQHVSDGYIVSRMNYVAKPKARYLEETTKRSL